MKPSKRHKARTRMRRPQSHQNQEIGGQTLQSGGEISTAVRQFHIVPRIDEFQNNGDSPIAVYLGVIHCSRSSLEIQGIIGIGGPPIRGLQEEASGLLFQQDSHGSNLICNLEKDSFFRRRPGSLQLGCGPFRQTHPLEVLRSGRSFDNVKANSQYEHVACVSPRIT